MPLLRFSANFDIEDAVSTEIMNETVKALAPVMEKSVDYYVSVWEKEKILFGLTADPAALVTLSSIGKITPELNKQYASAHSSPHRTQRKAGKD